ncbi:hypothetical protein EDD86DRAFT_198207 [Gorgonomyces haynaldii]|nr:hypothetical protein EDD86DRAFT_198207 [Gorgonomyces haynaldii]
MPAIQDIPPELWAMVAEHLDIKSLSLVLRSCKRLYECMHQQRIWFQKCQELNVDCLTLKSDPIQALSRHMQARAAYLGEISTSEFSAHEHAVSSICAFKNTIITGSWDGSIKTFRFVNVPVLQEQHQLNAGPIHAIAQNDIWKIIGHQYPPFAHCWYRGVLVSLEHLDLQSTIQKITLDGDSVAMATANHLYIKKQNWSMHSFDYGILEIHWLGQDVLVSSTSGLHLINEEGDVLQYWPVSGLVHTSVYPFADSKMGYKIICGQRQGIVQLSSLSRHSQQWTKTDLSGFTSKGTWISVAHVCHGIVFAGSWDGILDIWDSINNQKKTMEFKSGILSMHLGDDVLHIGHYNGSITKIVFTGISGVRLLL